MLTKNEPSLAEIVGKQLRYWRKQRQMTLADLAKLCGTTPQTISRLESADMTINVGWLEKCSKALRIRPSDLVGPSTKDAYVRGVEDGRSGLARELSEFLREGEGKGGL